MVFKRFVRFRANIFHKYKCSVRKHIEEGICLPANNGFLSHNYVEDSPVTSWFCGFVYVWSTFLNSHSSIKLCVYALAAISACSYKCNKVSDNVL